MTNWLRKLVLSFLLPRPLRRVAGEIIAGLADGSLVPDPPLRRKATPTLDENGEVIDVSRFYSNVKPREN